MSALLDVRDLHVWFNLPNGRELHAVQGVGFDVAAGQRFGLVGESGCGKTTAILAFMGLLPSSASVSGQVLFDGDDVLVRGEESARPHRWKDIAMVFQGAMNAFSPVQTIGSQIVEALDFHGVASGAAAKARTSELLDLVGISPEAGARFPHEFSGGMRQRAALAMALACRPRVLLADEPTTALDVMVQAQILQLLVRFCSEFNLTLVLVTHDLPIVSQICQRVAVMYAGRLVESGTVDELFHEPGHPYTRLLFAATPDLYGESDVASIPGAPPRLDQRIVGCAFQPRCDSSIERCTVERPQLVEIGPGHRAACHLNDL
jgi:peptide/nickel transport system ATP-binding protein